VENYSQRPWAQRILDTCSDPEQAFENWMKRDYQFGKRIIQQASKLKYRVIIVDGTISIQELFNQVCNYLGLGS
jgi:hypothetical protein